MILFSNRGVIATKPRYRHALVHNDGGGYDFIIAMAEMCDATVC